MLRATDILRYAMQGYAANMYALAQHYTTSNGHASIQFAYRAIWRAIHAGEIEFVPGTARGNSPGAIRLKA